MIRFVSIKAVVWALIGIFWLLVGTIGLFDIHLFLSFRRAAILLIVATSAMIALDVSSRMKQSRLAFWRGLAVISAVAIGLPVIGLSVRSSFLSQLGMLGIFVLVLLIPVLIRRRDRPDEALRAARGYLLGGAVFLSIFLLFGELAVRLMFSGGETFSTKAGPIVARYERDFVFNRYDGPSRGPEIRGPRTPGQIRILIQGDSITWGQGVRAESDLFSSRLREQLRDLHPAVEIAVLAKPGREIDGHSEQLKKWGDQISPDIVIYQWFVNDIEISESERPQGAGRIWRRFFLHPQLMSISYLWFFLDYSLDRVLPIDGVDYDRHILEQFSPGTDRWQIFVDVFSDWAREAKRHTPRIVVALYPAFGGHGERVLSEIYDDFEALCGQYAIETIDLWEVLEPLAAEPERLFASPYDSHPGAEAHSIIAQALFAEMAPLLRGLCLEHGSACEIRHGL